MKATFHHYVDGVMAGLVIEADWFQLTYNTLRAAPYGDDVAWFSESSDAWVVGQGKDKTLWTDVVISS